MKKKIYSEEKHCSQYCKNILLIFVINITCILAAFLGYDSITQGVNLSRIKLFLSQNMEGVTKIKVKMKYETLDTDMKVLRRNSVRARQ